MGTWSYEDTNANTIAIRIANFIKVIQIYKLTSATALNSTTWYKCLLNYNGIVASGGVTIPLIWDS